MSLNKISIIIFILFCKGLSLSAQVDSKYLAGAVPLVDKKVQFEREIKVSPTVSKEQLFDLVEGWMKEEFAEGKDEDSKQRILIADKDQSYLVAQGDEKLVFKEQILMVDRATITYQLIARVELGLCKLEVRNIRYEYQDYNDLVPAEKMITDKVALNKQGDKLNRHYDKFRTFTIDRVDQLRDNLVAHLGKVSLDDVKPVEPARKTILVSEERTAEEPKLHFNVPVREEKVEQTDQVRVVTDMPGYRAMKTSELSGAIIKMMKDSRAIVVASTDGESQALTATWSGMGNFGGKETAMTFINTGGHKLGSDATYTISFFTEIYADVLDEFEKAPLVDRMNVHGLTPTKSSMFMPTFKEAWLIIDCKLTMEQDSTESAVQENAQSKKWNDNKQVRMVMGEILQISGR